MGEKSLGSTEELLIARRRSPEMSASLPSVNSSPAVMKKGRCRSPGVHSKMSSFMTPGTRCLVFLRRCLAVQLQKVRMFPNSSATSCNHENQLERDAPLYWMYDSGYLIFQGFLEANLKCFWNGALIEAMKVLEFQGYIAPGVLLVSGTPCALEVVRAAWARNVLKPPSNYSITVVGDVEDCLVEPISQGQFTPLPEALCWIILDMTASGQAAVMESICSNLDAAFPDIQRPSEQLVYDTLAQLTAENKLYQTANGYFVMTPDKLRLSGVSNGISSKKEYIEEYLPNHQKQILLTPEEAAVKIHGEIETVRDGNVTHQAIQTNLADVICGGNPNDKILYPRVPSKMRSGISAERLERRHSLRFFGNGRRRSHSLQRSGSFKHISAEKTEKVQSAKDVSSPNETQRKHTSLFSRLFRRSERMRRDDSPSPVSRPTFSAQFPPLEWFNRSVTHLHSVGTQTSYLAPSTDTLPKRTFTEYDFDDMSLTAPEEHKRHISAFGTPRMVRRGSHSATLPRRSLPKKSSIYDKDAISRMSSQTSVAAQNPSSNGDVSCDTLRTTSRSSIASSKTLTNSTEVRGKNCASPTRKSLSSASSGYNSLPRSNYSSVRNARITRPSSSAAAKQKSHHQPKKVTPSENSITFHVSAKTQAESPKNETNATVTTTINGGNKTKIFLQQHNSPTRSLITFENTIDRKSAEDGHDIIIVNQPPTAAAARPTSLYTEQNNFKSNKQSARLLESELRMKCSSAEAIQLEEKSLEAVKDGKRVNNETRNVLHDLSTCKSQGISNKHNPYLFTGFGSETELNNAKNTTLTQNANVSLDKINNLKNTNILNEEEDKSKFRDHMNSEPASPMNTAKFHNSKFGVGKERNKHFNEKDLDESSLEDSKIKGYADFPSLSDLSLRFTSLAAQNILKGVGFNSMDTLVEVNMAAEKKRNCDLSISTDLGVV